MQVACETGRSSTVSIDNCMGYIALADHWVVGTLPGITKGLIKGLIGWVASEEHLRPD
jgi:hypothetical protein